MLGVVKTILDTYGVTPTPERAKEAVDAIDSLMTQHYSDLEFFRALMRQYKQIAKAAEIDLTAPLQVIPLIEAKGSSVTDK